MRGYGQFCPVAQTLEILGERWTLLVVRELLAGSHRFNDLMRGVPLMSRTMLSRRLKSLEDNGIVARRERGDGTGHEYVLTPAGEELRPIVISFGEWGQRWARRDPSADDLDAGLLMWDMRRNINLDRLPKKRTTVEFRLRGTARGQSRFWLVMAPEDVDLCLTRPGYDVDLVVVTHLRTLTLVWMDDLSLAAARRTGDLELRGSRAAVRGLPRWLGLSEFASVPRPWGLPVGLTCSWTLAPIVSGLGTVQMWRS